jgi:multidrug efflux pump
MMSARMLEPLGEAHNRIGAWIQAHGPVIARYDGGLQWVLAHQPFTLLVAVLTLA